MIDPTTRREALVEAVWDAMSFVASTGRLQAEAAVDAILADHYIVSRDEVEITQGHNAVSDWPAGLFPLPQEDDDADS